MVPDDLVELGVVRGAYGIKGWVRIAPFATDGAVLEDVARWWLLRDTEAKMVIVDSVKRHGTSIVAKWQRCESKEAADALKGTVVAVARSEFPSLPQGEHYVADLVGLRVVNREDVVLGTVSGLRSSDGGNSGTATQWLEVSEQIAAKAAKSGGEPKTRVLLIPLNDHYVEEIDSAGRLIRVDWQRDW